jgi:hypothetical protein
MRVGLWFLMLLSQFTPLGYALDHDKSVELIALLLEHGASLSTLFKVDGVTYTAESFAAQMGERKLLGAAKGLNKVLLLVAFWIFLTHLLPAVPSCSDRAAWIEAIQPRCLAAGIHALPWFSYLTCCVLQPVPKDVTRLVAMAVWHTKVAGGWCSHIFVLPLI